MEMTIDYDLFKYKLNALSSEFFAVTDGKQALPILSIHQILRECEVGEYFPYRTAYFNGVRDGRATARPQGEWIPVSERLPEERTDPNTNDFEYVLCSTIWDDVRPYKYGKPTGYHKAHFWHGGGIMDEAVIAWQYKPDPYKKGGAK